MTAVRQIRVIGVGVGGPGQLTLDAVAALKELDVVLVADKGAGPAQLLDARRVLLETHRPAPGGGTAVRLVQVPDPHRGPDPRETASYLEGVRTWHEARVDAYAAILDSLERHLVVGFLVWGDPALYDSTLRIVRALGERLPVQVRTVPGVTALSALAAAHDEVLHGIGEPVHVTTGRRLRREWHPGLGTVVVMLDGDLRCRDLLTARPETADLELLWGAYLGLPQQRLARGRLGDVVDDVAALRARLREEHGWVMDVYALRPAPTAKTPTAAPAEVVPPEVARQSGGDLP